VSEGPRAGSTELPLGALGARHGDLLDILRVLVTYGEVGAPAAGVGRGNLAALGAAEKAMNERPSACRMRITAVRGPT
jgi:hypothetical protein